MDAASLHNILLHTFSNEEVARKAAEDAVANLHNVRGSILLLIQIAVEESVAREIRQAAAVSLKNLVQKYWEGDENAQGQWVDLIPADEKAVSRQNALEALLVTHDNSIRSLLAETVSYIARFDFPENWPTLIDEICKNIQSGDATRIINALLALRRVVKNFEYRSEERLEPLYKLVEVVFPMLLNMLTQLQGNNSLEAANMMHLIMKTYWSCVKTNLPPHIAQTENVIAWMNLFRVIIAKPLPEASEGAEPLGQPTDEEERGKWPWWKLKKWALQILCRFYTRYGNPKKSEEVYVEMSTVYRNQIAPELLSCVMETLALRKNGRFCPDRVVQLCLVFLQEAVDSSVAYKLIKPHLGFVIFEVIHPVLCLTPKDLALWAEDPHEFVRKTNDVFEDFLDPVYAASNLLADLCTKRGKDCLTNVLTFYTNILNTYLSKPETERDYIQKDAALHALFSLDGVLTKSKAHKDQVEAMIINHILPEFKNPHGFLRLRACKVFSRKYIEAIKFQNEQTLVDIVNGMLDAMFDPELPVRIEAAKTIRFVVMYPHSDTVVDVLRPRLPQILEQFFSLMDQIGNDEVVVALEHIIDRFSNEIGPFSVQLVAKFVEFFQQFTAQAEDDEDASLAAVSCLDAINTILMSIHNHPELYNLMVPTLGPVIQKVLTDFDYVEYMESGIDILGSIAFYSQKISPQLWSLFPLIFTSYNDWAADYLTNFVPVIDNFVGRDIDGFLSGVATDPAGNQVRYLELVFNMAKGVFENDKVQEIDLCAACRLLYSLLHNLFGKIDECIPAIVLMTCKRLSEPLVDSTARNLFGVLGSLFHYNPVITLSTMESLGATAGVFKIWLGDLTRYDNYLDRKLFILGVMSILKVPVEQIPAPLHPHMKQLVLASMTVLKEAIQHPQSGIHIEGDEDSDDEGAEQFAELLENGGYDSNEDAEDVVDDQYYAILKQLREEAEGTYGFDDEGDDDYMSMLDEVDEVEFFLSTLQGFSQTYTAEYQSFGLEADADAQQLLAVFADEHNRRVESKANSRRSESSRDARSFFSDIAVCNHRHSSIWMALEVHTTPATEVRPAATNPRASASESKTAVASTPDQPQKPKSAAIANGFRARLENQIAAAGGLKLPHGSKARELQMTKSATAGSQARQLSRRMSVDEMKEWYRSTMQPGAKDVASIPFAGFTRLRRLGKGGFGEVWDVRDDSSGICYALKHIASAHSASAMTEIRVGLALFPTLDLDKSVKQANLTHPDDRIERDECFHDDHRHPSEPEKHARIPFAQLFRVVQANRDFWLLYERGGRTLHELLFGIQGEFHRGSRIYRLEHRPLYQQMRADLGIVQCLFKQLLEAVQVLAEHQIVHADIKPDNILLQWRSTANPSSPSRPHTALHVQLIDFGSAFVKDRNLRGGGGTPEYVPPEALVPLAPPPNPQTSSSIARPLTPAGGGASTESCTAAPSSPFDVWSVGAVFLELLSGFPLWFGYRSRIDVAGNACWVKSGGLFTTKHRDPASIQRRQLLVVADLECAIQKYPGMLNDWPPEIAASVLDLLSQLLNPCPHTRVSPQVALAHPFFRIQRSDFGSNGRCSRG